MCRCVCEPGWWAKLREQEGKDTKGNGDLEMEGWEERLNKVIHHDRNIILKLKGLK